MQKITFLHFISTFSNLPPIVFKIPQKYLFILVINILLKYICIMSEKDIQMARARILSDSYGKFDGIELLLDPLTILSLRPRQLRRKVADMLELDLNQIPNKTFMSWLYRYKSRRGRPALQSAEARVSDITPVIFEKKGEEGDGWIHFKASDPKPMNDNQEVLIQFPDYGPAT